MIIRKIVIASLGAILMASIGVSAFAASPDTSTSKTRSHCKDTTKRHCEGQGVKSAYFNAEAKALGTTPQDLAKALHSGHSISDLAGSKNFTQATFAQGVKGNLKPALDSLVANHELAPKQEAKILSALDKGHVANWGHESKKHGHKAHPNKP